MSARVSYTVSIPNTKFAIKNLVRQTPKAVRVGLNNITSWYQRGVVSAYSNRILHRRTGRLSRSVKKTQLYRRGYLYRQMVGTNVVYAGIHEKGGVIRPKQSQFLAVPTEKAKSRAGVPRYSSPLRQSLPGDVQVVRVGFKGRDHLFLGRPRGKQGLYDFLYVLRRRVRIPKRPVWRPLMNRKNKSRMFEMMVKAFEGVGLYGWRRGQGRYT